MMKGFMQQAGAPATIAFMFFAGTAVSLWRGVPLGQVMKNYSYGVLVILICMDLFTGLIAETGIMQRLAVKIAERSEGRRRSYLVMSGAMMFLVSAFLNNITAVMMVLPVIFILMKAIEVDGRLVRSFFAAILALSNTGGAASPIGDFPAIVIMKSGVTDFLNYFVRAFPLFALTSLALLGTWAFTLRGEEDADALRKLAILNLKSQYKNRKTRFDVLARLGAVFATMFAAWSFIPQETMPPELVAALGYAAAMIVCSLKGMRLNLTMDMKSVLMIASFLFLAEAVSQTGLLRVMALRLQDGIEDQRSLVAVLMVVASLLAGVFSAGPAAAAMMPVIAELCRGPLQAQAHWLAVAYAAAICAGSSLFMWSATAGFILSDKVNGAALEDGSGRKVCWGWREYFGYGVANYLIQISIALAVVLSAF